MQIELCSVLSCSEIAEEVMNKSQQSLDSSSSDREWQKKVGNYRVGSGHGKAKLTEADIPVIRARLRAGEKWRDIAASYGISCGTLSSILRGVTWAHVPDAESC